MIMQITERLKLVNDRQSCDSPKMPVTSVLRFRVTRHDRFKPRFQANKSSGKPQTDQYALLTRTELPQWMEPNPFVLSGYRCQSNSAWSSLMSWTYLHNESCNIYSHMIPALLLLVLPSALHRHIRERIPTLTDYDWAFLSCQLRTAAACLLTSSLYHTLLNHSEHVAHRWLQFDYLGIVALILGNFISGLHFGFYCDPSLNYGYSAIVSIMHLLRCALLEPRIYGLRRIDCYSRWCNRRDTSRPTISRTKVEEFSHGHIRMHGSVRFCPYRSCPDAVGSGIPLARRRAVLPGGGTVPDHRLLPLGAQ